MWAFVHWFPEGHRPQPKAVIQSGAVVRLETTVTDGLEKITRVIVERGRIEATNVSESAVSGERLLPPTLDLPAPGGGTVSTPVQVLAPDVLLGDAKEKGKFGVENVPVVLQPDVEVKTTEVVKHFDPAAFNPAHNKYIARSDKAKPMAVNMYSAFWTLCICIAVTFVVSLVTKPKSDEELKNLVMGLTPLPDEGPCPWYEKPLLWAGLVGAVLLAVNIIFW